MEKIDDSAINQPLDADASVTANLAGNFDEAAPDWGMQRHALIATAASERLQSQNAREQIARILEEGGEPSLGEAARWADKLRSSNKPNDPATKRFLSDSKNAGYSTWHYVNMPTGVVGYDRQQYPKFTRPNDVVQTLLLSFESLLHPGPQARFEEITALRWLTHLAGDVHQPVHVGCGYIAAAKTNAARLEFDPTLAVALPSDRGGNELVLPLGINLHSFWDSVLGPNVIPTPLDASSEEQLIAALPTPPPAATNATQSIQQLVSGWATATVVEARKAYEGMHITSYSPSDEGDYTVDWEGDAAYRQRCSPIVSERMGAAASNLAHLLDRLWP